MRTMLALLSAISCLTIRLAAAAAMPGEYESVKNYFLDNYVPVQTEVHPKQFAPAVTTPLQPMNTELGPYYYAATMIWPVNGPAMLVKRCMESRLKPYCPNEVNLHPFAEYPHLSECVTRVANTCGGLSLDGGDEFCRDFHCEDSKVGIYGLPLGIDPKSSALFDPYYWDPKDPGIYYSDAFWDSANPATIPNLGMPSVVVPGLDEPIFGDQGGLPEPPPNPDFHPGPWNAGGEHAKKARHLRRVLDRVRALSMTRVRPSPTIDEAKATVSRKFTTSTRKGIVTRIPAM